MGLVDLSKLRVHILIKLRDGEVKSKTDLKKELRSVFQLSLQDLQKKDKLGRKTWDRDMTHQLSWLRIRGLIENEVINGREFPARIHITKLGQEILKFCDNYKKIQIS